MTREELQSAIQDFWDEAFHYGKHEISDTSKAIALECMMDAAERENPKPLTLEEVKEHITKGHPNDIKTSVYKGYKQDKIEMRGDRAEISDFPLYLNTVAGGLDCRDQTIGGFSFVVKIYAVPVIEIIG